MKIGLLLAAGRSVSGQKDRVGHYRAVNPRSMPKFEGAGGPARPLPAASTAKETQEPAVSASVKEPSPAESVTRKPAPFPGPICRADLPKKQGFWRRLMSMFGFGGGRAVATGSVARRPIQVELRLDHVKVVRNDLSDADLEIVRVQAPALKAPEPSAQSVAPADKRSRSGALGILRMLS